MLSRNILSCRRAQWLSSYRTLATQITETATTGTASPSILSPSSKRLKKTQLYTAVILNRSPILTPKPTPFEQAYYNYQARIRRALHNPFPYDFYFKQGSLLETRFNLEDKEREKHAFGPKYAKDDFVDEEKAAADQAAVEQLAQQEGEGAELISRVHPSDIKQDLKSLDRIGERNLYLLVHSKENGTQTWRFPQGSVQKGQLLHHAAQIDLQAECGENMDTWIVSRNPIGVHLPVKLTTNEPQSEEVVFFFKAHIMAGQVRIQTESIQDFAWLTKEEISSRVEMDYWYSVKDLLSE